MTAFGGTSLPNIATKNTIDINKNGLHWQFPLSLLSTRSTIELDFKIRAVPTTGTQEIYRGDIITTKKILWTINVKNYLIKCRVNSTTAMLPLDNAPGGVYDLNEFGFDENVINAQLTSFLPGAITTVLQPRFCFVPTVSSLAFANPTTYFSSNICNTAPCEMPTAIFDYFAPQQNELHTSFTQDNTNWLLQVQSAAYNCTRICPLLTIAGDANFCTTSNAYTIPNLPAGATVVWTISPPRAVTINTPNATQTTLTKVNNGPITLTATISSDCGANIVIQKEIYMGPEPVNILGAFDPTYHTIMGEVCVGDPYYFVAGDPVSSNPLNTYTWTHFPPPGSPNSISLFSGANLNITFIEPGMHTLRVTKTNNCGEVITNRVIEVLECFNFMYYSISPNPASSTINIGVNTKNTSQNRHVEPGSLNIDDVKIYDATGFLRLQQKGNKQQSVTINTSALTNGLFRVEISHAGKVERQQLLINR